MYGRIQADNFFNTTISSLINDTSSSGTFSIASKTVNGYTLEDGTYMFWMIVGLSNQDELEIFRITNVSGTTLTYDRRISPNGLYNHTIGQVCVMTVASDYCNWLSNNTNDFGYTENVTGTGNELKVKVYGGRVENPSDSDVVVADTTLTLTDNTTNYIYFDDTDNTFKSGISEPETYKVLASVITLSGAITSITDLRAIKAILGAVPLSLSTTDRTSLANVRPGTIVYDVDDDVNYQYLGGSWYPISAGSTQPRATETVEGKVRVATTSEYNANTDVGGDGATLVPKLSQTKPTAGTGINVTGNQVSVDTNTIATKTYVDTEISETGGILSSSDYIAGEDIIKGNCLFIETPPFYKESQSVKNIGDVTGNTRVCIRVVGGGNAFNKIKLALKKFVSPSVNLGIRIETDNSETPSGTTVTNGTATVLASSLTTSLVDTLITLDGNVTLTKGTVYWIVLFAGTYGSETVNATNYFGIGYNTNNTTMRYGRSWNGSSWGSPDGNFYYVGTIRDGILSSFKFEFENSLIDTSGNTSLTSSNNVTYATSLKGLAAVFNGTNSAVVGALTNPITGVFSFSVNIYRTGTGVGNGCIFDFGTYGGNKGFGLWIDTSNRLSWRINNVYNNYVAINYTVPLNTWVNIIVTYDGTNVSVFVNRVLQSSIAHTTNPTTYNDYYFGKRGDTNEYYAGYIDELYVYNYVIPEVQAEDAYQISTGLTTSLFEYNLLGKADARYIYKIPDRLRVAKNNYNIGETPLYDYFGTTILFDNIIKDRIYFLSNTPGEISLTQGTYKYIVGVGVKNNKLNLTNQVYEYGNTVLYSNLTSIGVPKARTKTKEFKVLKPGYYNVSYKFNANGVYAGEYGNTSVKLKNFSNDIHGSGDSVYTGSGASVDKTKIYQGFFNVGDVISLWGINTSSGNNTTSGITDFIVTGDIFQGAII